MRQENIFWIGPDEFGFRGNIYMVLPVSALACKKDPYGTNVAATPPPEHGVREISREDQNHEYR